MQPGPALYPRCCSRAEGVLLLGRPSGTAGSMAGRPAATEGLCSPEWLLKASEPGAPKAKPPVEARPDETVAIECTAGMAHMSG